LGALPTSTLLNMSQRTEASESSRVVSKPVPQSQTQDPRKYQIEQLKKRFAAQISNLQNGVTNVSFHLKPSDPDFPFELDYLDCEVQVPRHYPEGAPLLRVKNKDIPRGFGINIESGWDKLVSERKNATLLNLTNALDKNLEALLSEQKSETVTLMTFKDTRHLDSSPATSTENTTRNVTPQPVKAPPPARPYIPEESFTREQMAEAKARRAQETRQLEARMGRMSLFHKSADGIVYTLPLEPRRRSELPVELRPITSVQLIIPLLYPLQPLRILLNDVESKDAEVLEELFFVRASQQKQMTLMSHLNYLAQNIHVLAKTAQSTLKQTTSEPQEEQQTADPSIQTIVDKDNKNHVQVIQRPPEWTLIDEHGDSEGSSSDEWDSEDDSDGGGVLVERMNTSVYDATHQVESGTSISFPLVELHGIELLQVTILGLNVKCERCRTINEVTGLKPNTEKASSCKKCATPFTIKFRPEMVHQNSVRAGFIDVAGCTVADMLPRCVSMLIARTIVPKNKDANIEKQYICAYLWQVLITRPRSRICARRGYDQCLSRMPVRISNIHYRW
jgi:phage FluMu protein Com